MNRIDNTVKKYNALYTIKECNQKMYVSDGNEKLKETKHVKFMIWNIPAKLTCPYATEMCRHSCYAVKAENLYPDCLPCRERNFRFSQTDEFVDYMIAYISVKLNHLKAGKRFFFRIHESGDFYNKAYTKKWLSIMRYFEDDSRVVFMAYTKSIRFFVGEVLPKNFCLRFSVWEDTKAEEIAIAEKMGLPIYTAMTEEQLKAHPEYFACKCASCGDCGACYHNGVKMIACKIH